MKIISHYIKWFYTLYPSINIVENTGMLSNDRNSFIQVKKDVIVTFNTCIGSVNFIYKMIAFIK